MVKLSEVRGVINYHKRMKDVFRRKGMYRVYESPTIEQILKGKGIAVTDPETFINPPPAPYVPNPEDLYPDFRSGVHEILQEKKKEQLESSGKQVWHLSDRIPFTEGLEQACLLTKSVLVDGLPSNIQQLFQKYTIPDQSVRINNTIYHSQLWDNTKYRLPRRRDVENLSWKYRREYGIPDSKSATYVLHSFLQYSQLMCEQFPILAEERQIMFKPEIQLRYMFRGETINIAAINEFMVYGREALPPFADSAFVQETADQKLPDMYPVSPTIDLEKRFVMPLEDKPALHNGLELDCSHPQILVRRNNFRGEKSNQALNIMLTFAAAYNEAKLRHGNTTGQLPKPVTVMNINGSYNNLNFLVFQLNTLDLDSSDGVKNIVWADTQNKFFERIMCQPWKHPERKITPTQYENFAGNAFEKFLAVYMYNYDRIVEPKITIEDTEDIEKEKSSV